MEENIGIKIKEKRKELQMTQEELAEKIGVTFQAVSKWENSASMPDISLIKKIAQTLNISIEELMSGEKTVEQKENKSRWGDITGIVTKDIHADVGKIIGEVKADIYGNVMGNIVGTVNNVYGNVEGNITGYVNGNITGYVSGNLYGNVMGSVKLGVRGKIRGTIVGDGINVMEDENKFKKMIKKINKGRSNEDE